MVNFTAWPEMLAWPYLMLQGWLPYRDIGVAHNPLLLLDIAIYYKIFGLGVMQLKIYTWILIAINIYLVYFVATKFWSKSVAILSTIIYLLLLIVYDGNALWFDLALVPFALLLYYFTHTKNYLWAGIIFALGFLTKQTFVYFAIPTGIILFQNFKFKIQSFKKFIFGTIPVFGIFALILFALGILDDYYKWAIEFGIFYLPNAEGQISLPTLKQLLFALTPFLIFTLNFNLLLSAFALVGLMGVYPRWELFHFQPALPFLAIAVSTFYFSKRNMIFKVGASIILILFISVGLFRQVGSDTRFYENDVVIVTEEIRKSGSKELYVINYWDSLYALTNTTPPKPLIPYIPWYFSYNDNYQRVISNLKLNMPEVIVIGERENKNFELYDFVDKFYTCDIVDKNVELCRKNN